MKKLNASIDKTFGPVILYLEDLNEIERILHENCEDLRISHENYEYDSLQEATTQIGAKEIREIILRAKNPDVNVRLRDMIAAVYVTDGDATKASGIYHQIEKIISRCQRKPRWMYRPSTPFIIGILGGVALIFVRPPVQWALLAIYGVIVIVVGTWGVWIDMFRHSLIRLFTRPSSFIARNRDQLMVATLSAVLGAMFGFLLANIGKWLSQ